jgi:hypothetical protein
LRPGTDEWNRLPEDEFSIAIDCSARPRARERRHTAGDGHLQCRAPGGIAHHHPPPGDSIHYIHAHCTAFCGNSLVSGVVNVKPPLTHEPPLEQFDKGTP